MVVKFLGGECLLSEVKSSDILLAPILVLLISELQISE